MAKQNTKGHDGFMAGSAVDEGDDLLLAFSDYFDDAGSDTHEDDSSPADSLSQTTRLVTKLPPELRNMIMCSLFEAAFCPGFVYPQTHLNHKHLYDRSQGSNSAARPELLSEARTHINKIDLTFSTRTLVDVYARWETGRQWGWDPIACEKDLKPGDDTTGNASDRKYEARIALHMKYHFHDEFDPHRSDFNAAHWVRADHYGDKYEEAELQGKQLLLNYWLLATWSSKVANVLELPLTEITLDFSECYGINGQWLGDDLWSPVYDGERLSAVVRIYAPDLEKQERLERTIHCWHPQ
ncbi:MAG: hypothetical protein Q9170_003697 [Blastenia crenularia]